MTTIRSRIPLFGTREDWSETVVSILGALGVTFLYVLVAEQLGTTTSWLEIWSLVFSFSCVWLSRSENIFSMHAGIIASVLTGVFLFRIDVVAQAWLQFLFFVPIQLYGWWHWCRGGEARTELAITKLTRKGWVKWLIIYCLIWLTCMWVFSIVYSQPQYLLWDTSIVGASVLAQMLMTLKKIECWLIWIIPVNVSSAAFFVVTDVPAFVLMYVVFLVNASLAYRNWLLTFERENG